MLEWKNVLQLVGSTLGSSAGDCVLEFLRVLPEEVTEGRKINLTVRPAETPSTSRDTPGIVGNRHQYLIYRTTLRKRSLQAEQKSCWKTMLVGY